MKFIKYDFSNFLVIRDRAPSLKFSESYVDIPVNYKGYEPEDDHNTFIVRSPRFLGGDAEINPTTLLFISWGNQIFIHVRYGKEQNVYFTKSMPTAFTYTPPPNTDMVPIPTIFYMWANGVSQYDGGYAKASILPTLNAPFEIDSFTTIETVDSHQPLKLDLTEGPNVPGWNALLMSNSRNEEYLINDKTPSLFNPPPTGQLELVIAEQPRTYFRETTVYNEYEDTIWPFSGKTLIFELNPRTSGDFLKHLYIHFPTSLLIRNNHEAYKFIQKATLYVDETPIESITSEWIDIYRRLYISETERNAFIQIHNNDDVRTQLYVPLHFFFTRSNSENFRLSSCYNQKVYVSIEFTNQTSILNNLITGTNTTAIRFLSIPYITLVTEEVFLPNDQKKGLQHNFTTDIQVPQTHAIDKIDRNATDMKISITQTYPTLYLHWYVTSTEKESQMQSQTVSELNTILENVIQYPPLSSSDAFKKLYQNISTEVPKETLDITQQLYGTLDQPNNSMLI